MEAGTLRNTCSLEMSLREKSSFAGRRGKPTHILPWGRPMTPWKKQARAHGVPPGYGVQHPRNDSQNNVGKLPRAAGTGYNLQGLSKRGQKLKEERAQRERRMSP